MKLKYILFCFIVFFAFNVFAQNSNNNLSIDLDLASACIISDDDNTKALALPAFEAEVSLCLGSKSIFDFGFGFLYQASSSYDSNWRKYRAFFGYNAIFAFSYKINIFEPFAKIKAYVCNYVDSFSWFFYPQIELGLRSDIFGTNKKVSFQPNISVPIEFRKDCFSYGIKIGLTCRFDIGKNNDIVK